MTAPAPGLRTVALAKQVPRSDQAATLDQDGRLRRADLDTEMNPFCRRAVAHAVRLAEETGGTSTVITMGPPSANDVAREALAWGAQHAVHLCDQLLAGADCLVTARALAAAVRQQGEVDLLLVGRSSVDGDTAAVGPMLAEYLGLPFVGPAIEFAVEEDAAGVRTMRVKLQHDGVVADVRVALPAVVAVAERSGRPAKASPETWPAPHKVRNLTLLDLGSAVWGKRASPTFVRQVRQVGASRQATVLTTGSLPERVAHAVALLGLRDALPSDRLHPRHGGGSVPHVSGPCLQRPVLVAVGEHDERGAQALLGEAAVLAERIGSHVVAIAPEHLGPQLARWGADQLIAPTSYDARPLAAVLATLLPQEPWAILGPATPWGRELLGRLATRLRAGLISDAIAVEVEEGAEPRLVGLKPCGFGQIAEIGSHAVTQVVTLRTGCLPVRLPRSPDAPLAVTSVPVERDPSVRVLGQCAEDDYEALDRAETVIGLGRGVDPSAYPDFAELRTLLDAELAATRAVTDQAWLPQSRQVGITARAIAPHLYIATAISGSPYHMAGVGRAGTILAINADPQAEIFAHADIGIVGDWRLVVPLLTKEVTRRLARPRIPSQAC